MKLIHLSFLSFLGFAFLSGCNEDESEEMGSEPVVITTQDFAVTIDEDPTEGQILGKVNGTASVGEVSFSLTSQDPIDAMSIDASSGELKVKNVSAFDFETRQEVTAEVTVKSGDISEEAKVTITITDVPVVVTTADFSASLDENPEIGKSLGMVTGTASEGSVAFAITEQEVADALSINATTGELKINEVAAFDFETRTSLTATVAVTGGSDVKEAKVTLTINNVTEIVTSDIAVTIDENPANGQVIATVSASVDRGDLIYSIIHQTLSGALTIDANTGSLTVEDSSLFDYERYVVMQAIVEVKGEGTTNASVVTITLQDVAPIWQTVGMAGFSGSASDVDMAIDDSGIPYVVYQDLNNFGYITCKKFDGTSWIAVGNEGFSGSEARKMKIEIVNGTPYVAYISGSGSFRWPRVQKFDGSTWVNVGNYLATNTSNYTDMFFNSGRPYVVYSDESNSGKNTVKWYNGTKWILLGTEGFSDGGTLSNSLVIGNNGESYAAFYDIENGGATVMKYLPQTNWQPQGNKAFVSGQYTSLAYQSGFIYLAFSDGDNASKATVMKFGGVNWEAMGSAGFSEGTAFYTNLVFDRFTPYVAFQDGGNSSKATLMKYDGSNWVNVGDAGFSAGKATFVKLAFHNGMAYVAYSDGANGNKATVMRYAE